MTRFVAAVLPLLCLAGPALAQQQQPVVVELFTSQSCSSCPPADALLADIKEARSDVLALDLHVTYWDYLNWKDPYSLTAATERQQRYSHIFGRDEVYTPQMVIGGRRQAIGSNRSAVMAAIEAAKAEINATPPVPLQIATAGGRLSIGAGSGQGAATMLLVGFDLHHTTSVRGGENAGRTLSEVNVVRSIQPVATWTGLPLTMEIDRPPGDSAALLLQAPDGRYLGAAVLRNPT